LQHEQVADHRELRHHDVAPAHSSCVTHQESFASAAMIV
jgi:hypothetical protein